MTKVVIPSNIIWKLCTPNFKPPGFGQITLVFNSDEEFNLWRPYLLAFDKVLKYDLEKLEHL